MSALIFPSKTSGLATRDYEDDDFEEVLKGHFLMGAEDVLDVDEVSKCREGIPAWKATPTKNNSHAADGSPMHTEVCIGLDIAHFLSLMYGFIMQQYILLKIKRRFTSVLSFT